jgi:protein-disulfide isomerase
MAEEIKEGKTLVIGKKTLIAIIVVVTIFLGAAIYMYAPSQKGDYFTDDDPSLGISSATVYVIEFSDYECPFCQAAEGTNSEVIAQLMGSDPTWQAPVPKIINNYVNTGKVKLIFRQYPVHRDTRTGQLIVNPALAAKCAQEQGNFWDYHMLLFRNYSSLSDTDLKKYAMDVNLDINKFNECFITKKYLSQVQKSLSDGLSLGITGTPTFFIGNNETGYEVVSGAESFLRFQSVIDSKLG